MRGNNFTVSFYWIRDCVEYDLWKYMSKARRRYLVLKDLNEYIELLKQHEKTKPS